MITSVSTNEDYLYLTGQSYTFSPLHTSHPHIDPGMDSQFPKRGGFRVSCVDRTRDRVQLECNNNNNNNNNNEQHTRKARNEGTAKTALLGSANLLQKMLM